MLSGAQQKRSEVRLKTGAVSSVSTSKTGAGEQAGSVSGAGEGLTLRLSMRSIVNTSSANVPHADGKSDSQQFEQCRNPNKNQITGAETAGNVGVLTSWSWRQDSSSRCLQTSLGVAILAIFFLPTNFSHRLSFNQGISGQNSILHPVPAAFGRVCLGHITRTWYVEKNIQHLGVDLTSFSFVFSLRLSGFFLRHRREGCLVGSRSAGMFSLREVRLMGGYYKPHTRNSALYRTPARRLCTLPDVSRGNTNTACGGLLLHNTIQEGSLGSGIFIISGMCWHTALRCFFKVNKKVLKSFCWVELQPARLICYSDK